MQRDVGGYVNHRSTQIATVGATALVLALHLFLVVNSHFPDPGRKRLFYSARDDGLVWGTKGGSALICGRGRLSKGTFVKTRCRQNEPISCFLLGAIDKI